MAEKLMSLCKIYYVCAKGSVECLELSCRLTKSFLIIKIESLKNLSPCARGERGGVLSCRLTKRFLITKFERLKNFCPCARSELEAWRGLELSPHEEVAR